MQSKNNWNPFYNNTASTHRDLHENSAKIVIGSSASETIFIFDWHLQVLRHFFYYFFSFIIPTYNN